MIDYQRRGPWTGHRKKIEQLLEGLAIKDAEFLVGLILASNHFLGISMNRSTSEWPSALWETLRYEIYPRDPQWVIDLLVLLAADENPYIRTEVYSYILDFELLGRGHAELEHIFWEVAPGDSEAALPELRSQLHSYLTGGHFDGYSPQELAEKVANYVVQY
ncbi:hypothetical protein [Nesterenkonia muleiensis]|uniref:hypothetical protein n=1 Tax=Nesterenkonia muleiensis TaxID=2282648 RepID=UPI000E75F8C1|nr:hypothetical protein [Nesterenkonia muleiensis]